MSHFAKHKTLKDALETKIIEPEKIGMHVERLRGEKNASGTSNTIATLNGSFDLLHAGHLEMLFQAARQADILIVALNTDRSIQEYKSPLRPIIPLKHRLALIASLEMVDYVTWFDEIDPCHVLSQIKPDVHVNGAEYGQQCIERDTVYAHGGKLHIVELVPGLSTSQIIKKIVETCV